MNKAVLKVLLYIQVALLALALITSPSLMGPLLIALVVGSLQVILAFIFLFFWKNIAQRTRRWLTVYLTSVAVYFGGAYVLFEVLRFNDDLLLIPAIGIPIGLAILFVVITYNMNSVRQFEGKRQLQDVLDA